MCDGEDVKKKSRLDFKISHFQIDKLLNFCNRLTLLNNYGTSLQLFSLVATISRKM